MVIANGKIVNLAYELKNQKGEVLDKADGQSPFVYLHGASQVVPGLEDALTGLKTGDKKNVTVTGDQAYGDVDPSLKIEVKRAQFPKEMEIEVGMQFETETPQGDSLVFTIAGINGDAVTIDGNHPLAGETLHFSVEVLGVRDATKEEQEHGHAHGPGGQHVH